MKIDIRFEVGDYVSIDGDRSLQAVVLGASVSGRVIEEVKLHVSWIHNGAICSSWVEDWRVKLWEE